MATDQDKTPLGLSTLGDIGDAHNATLVNLSIACVSELAKREEFAHVMRVMKSCKKSVDDAVRDSFGVEVSWRDVEGWGK